MSLVVFDLDGTLVDSRKDLALAINEMLRELDARPLDERVVTSMVGEGARLLVERSLDAAGVHHVPVEAALQRFLRHYDAHLLDHTRPYPGIPEVVRDLGKEVALAVLTNKPTSCSERLLDGLRLRSAFREVIGGDSPFPRKPDPAALVHLMQAHGSRPDETIMVGDSRVDLETARAAGVPCCLVRYGFGFPAEVLQAPDLFIAESPERIADLVLGSLRTDRLLPRLPR